MNRDCMFYDDVSGHYMHEALVKTIQDCEATCEHMTHHLKMMVRDLTNRVDQSILLRDCADICTLTAKYVARDSCFAKRSATLCAEICVVCGNECTKFNDQMSQHCAMVCFNCARHCNEFASGKMNH